MGAFLSYFTNYIIRAKTRQKLLFLAVFGLFISSLSLMVLQGVMGGLQKGLMERSKKTTGVGYYQFYEDNQDEVVEVIELLDNNKIKYHPMLSVEMLVQHDTRVAPVTLNGFDPTKAPPFLKPKENNHVVLGADLATRIGAYYQSIIRFITPQFSDSLMGDIPRSSSELVSDFHASELVEIDTVNAWVRLNFVKNIIRKDMINRITFYNQEHFDRAQQLLPKLTPVRWEDQNQSLVWALRLETSVMLFLFASMSFLVAISITSGFMIFFGKIQKDLLSFWILGQSLERINKMTKYFSMGVGLLSTLLGSTIGLLILLAIDHYGVNFMPDFFVETKIPVHIRPQDFLISFLVPYSIALVFTLFALTQFRKDERSFISVIRSVGN
jgi:lipoprotein-releasing system permease protein